MILIQVVVAAGNTILQSDNQVSIMDYYMYLKA